MCGARGILTYSSFIFHAHTNEITFGYTIDLVIDSQETKCRGNHHCGAGRETRAGWHCSGNQKVQTSRDEFVVGKELIQDTLRQMFILTI